MHDDPSLDELIAGLEGLTLDHTSFRHREHLRTAYYYLMRDGYPFAIERTGAVIARFSAHHGVAERFHVTTTHCWVRLVAGALAQEPSSCSFDELLERHAELLDKNAPLRYYTRERLFSNAARGQWLEPDLADLPHCRIHGGRAACADGTFA